ncbi:multiubiquitin domain-containing protein [Streptacidiphilus sp. N1-12]|uniref:Multiubiquitin domain-containing protein n=2 Tax=Streptacidiphilus alkalitolerans TaxID=3342712 RepID=A0ABV6VKL1_9ACTN
MPSSTENEHGREYKIVVNTREKTVNHDEVGFDELVHLAFNPVPTGPNVVFSIGYRHAAQHPDQGTLAVGGHVKIKNGTVFNVHATDKS